MNAQLPDGFYDETVSNHWNFPIGITFSSEGHCFIWEKDGLVYTTDEHLNKIEPAVIDIREEVASYLDHGLVGFVLDPDFIENGYVYLMYIVDRHHLLHFGTSAYDPDQTILDEATIGRITRFSLDPGTNFSSLLPNSRHIIIGKGISDGIPVIMASHGAGSLVFGTDGSLLASFGDQGSFTGPDPGSHPDTYFVQALEDGIISEKENIGAYKSQLVDNLNGKILRIDPVSGEGMPGNPFYDPENPNSAKSKVYTLGIRNAFRFIKIPNTGLHDPNAGEPGILIVGEVGSSFWEEINIIRNGGENLGWPIFEGNYRNWQFQNFEVPNMDAPNLIPDSCEQEFLYFNQLIFDEQINPFSFEHPCDPMDTLSHSVAFVHKRASISYGNVKSGQDTIAEIAAFDENGKAISLSIEDPESPILGNHFGGYTSIAGAYYAEDHFPAEFQNSYYHCDLGGWIKKINFDQDYHMISIEDFHSDVGFILGMAVNPRDGQIYYINVLNELHRIGFGGNRKPKPEIWMDKAWGPGPLTISFDATNSIDEDGEIVHYSWDFGDGQTAEDAITNHTFTNSGSPQGFEVSLTVIDNEGAIDSISKTVSINNSPPFVEISSLKHGQFYPGNRYNNFTLEANVQDKEHEKDKLHYTWETFLHHNSHFHPEPIHYTPVAQANLQPIGCGEENYWYRIKLKVEDNGGLTGTDEIEIFPYCGDDIVLFKKIEAKPSKKDVNLYFEVEKLSSLKSYFIERSHDGEAYNTIGKIDDIENASMYHFIDKTPFIKNNFYRIRAETVGGIIYYSNAVQAIFPRLEDYQVFPNPAKDMVNIYARNANGILHFYLYDITGKKVYYNFWPTQNTYFRKSIPTTNVESGTYIYTILHANGTESGILLIQHE